MTRNVPNASESGTLRRGLMTSPAAKVMLFHASPEKSELVCATQMPTKTRNAPAAQRPETTEIFSACAGSHADDDAEHDQRDQCASFRRGKNVLPQLSNFQAAGVREREKSDQRQAHELCGGK